MEDKMFCWQAVLFLTAPYNILLLVSSLKSLYLIKDIETGICDVSHGVFECPDDWVEDQLELSRGDRQKCGEAVVVDSLKKKNGITLVLQIPFARITLFFRHQRVQVKNGGLTCRRRKKFVLCSGNSSKSLLIISSVHSKRASNIFGMWSVMLPFSLFTVVDIVDRTSGSLADGTLRN